MSAKVVLSRSEGEVDSAKSACPDSSTAASLMNLLELSKLTVHSLVVLTLLHTVDVV